jgi:hypothetical protein
MNDSISRRACAALTFAVIAALASGCTHQLHVGKPLGAGVKEVALSVKAGSGVEVKPEMLQEVQATFASKLTDAGVVIDDRGVRVSGEIVHLEEGNRALRYLIGSGLGRAVVVISWTVESSDGQPLAQLRTESEVSGGLFGGSLASSLESAAGELAEYLRTPVPRS